MPVLLIVLLVVIAVVVVGGLLVGAAFKLLWWALIGLVIGALARLALPGRQAIGVLPTAGGGIAGALLGGVIADAIDVGRVLQFVLAVAVAAVIVLAIGAAQRRRGPDRA